MPRLKNLDVCFNRGLGGNIGRAFLANCTTCNVEGCGADCHNNPMRLPFISGSSLSSNDFSDIFSYGPEEAKSLERTQGEVVDLPRGHPLYEELTKHLSPKLAESNKTWAAWQKVQF